jgi:hypothetical protein
MTKDELIRENSENMAINVEEMSQQVKEHITNEFRAALRGLKGFKVR